VTKQKKKAKKETTFRSRNAPFIILSRAHSSNGQILLRYRVVFVFGVARELEEQRKEREEERRLNFT
jgi:hypothetical protein